MSQDENEDQNLYVVVVNVEGQYSIWAADKPIPDGWSKSEKEGPKADCLEFIKGVWTDMRPSSLRQKM